MPGNGLANITNSHQRDSTWIIISTISRDMNQRWGKILSEMREALLENN